MDARITLRGTGSELREGEPGCLDSKAMSLQPVLLLSISVSSVRGDSEQCYRIRVEKFVLVREASDLGLIGFTQSVSEAL